MTPYPADFADAHRRHWEDAELLFEQRRWANADQLYGFSAECGLKAVMKSQGMPVDAGRAATEPPRKHVQHLWPVFVDFIDGLDAARRIGPLPEREPFSGWSHHNRYAHDRHFTEDSVAPHRHAARDVVLLVQHAMTLDAP